MSGRPARRCLGLAVVVLLLGNGVAAYHALTAVEPVTVADAVDRYRAAVEHAPSRADVPVAPGATVLAASSTPGAPTDPGRTATAGPAYTSTTGSPASPSVAGGTVQPGVYVYDTQGFETVSLFGGARHDYPASTTMTVVAGGCGLEMRWDALEQRWDRWSLCGTGTQLDLAGFSIYHEFYGKQEQRDWSCPPGTPARPATIEAGWATTRTCTSGAARSVMSITVVGREDRSVGGVTVPTLHVRTSEEMTGGSRGIRVNDTWYRVDDGLVVARTALVDVETETAIGTTDYHEELALSLTSLEPLR